MQGHSQAEKSKRARHCQLKGHWVAPDERTYIYIYARIFFDDYTLIITNHIYIHITSLFSWLIFCSCQPNHHLRRTRRSLFQTRKLRSVFWRLRFLFWWWCWNVNVICIYIQYVPFLTGIGKLFKTFGENFPGQKCGLRWFFPVDLSGMYGRNDANSLDSYGHLLLASPSSNLQVLWWFQSGRVMTSQCESESPKLHQLTSINLHELTYDVVFFVLEVSFFFFLPGLLHEVDWHARNVGLGSSSSILWPGCLDWIEMVAV